MKTISRKKKDPLESSIENDSRIHAATYGWVSRKMNGLGFNAWPDRLFIPPVKKKKNDKRSAFWVEFKRLGEEPTEAQSKMINDLRMRGQRVYVCHSVNEFELVLRSEDNV